MNGWITIGTELSTDKFDRQILSLEKKMKKEEEKGINIDAKLTSQEQELDRARKKTDELADAYQRLKSAQDRVASGKATPGQFATMQELQATYGTLEQIGNSFDKALTKQDAIEQKVANTRMQYQNINDKVSEYKQKIEGIKLQKQSAEVSKIKDGFKNVGSSIQNAINKVGKLAIGLFGIRTAYNLIRQASSELASYDSQYAANLEYIRYALTQAIAPVLRYIVGLAMQLLSYINAIANAWFGINIFGNASAKNFQKMKAGASGVSKAVKEIKKQLSGFDEINMLTDQSTDGGGGGGAGGSMPDFDLSALSGDVPDWIQFIIDHKDEILAIMAGIAAGLIAWKLGLDAIKALGLGIMIAGIVYAIEGIINYLNDPSWKNFGQIIQGIGIAIVGLGVMIASVPVAIAGAVVLILGTILKYWDKIKSAFQSGIDWLTEKSDWVHNMFGDTIGNIYDFITRTLQNILDWFDAVFTSIKGQFDGIIMFLKGVFTGNWNMAWEGIKKGFQSWWEGIKRIFTTTINYMKDMVVTVARTTGDIIAGAFKAVVNATLWAVENTLNSPIRSVNALIGVINKIPGVSISRLPTFSLPRLAVGGIVNMPNKGTLVGGAIAGESGKEGVIPLTDSQAMSELGREIGKNVIINQTNIISMNGRVLQKELKQVQNDEDFAYNT